MKHTAETPISIKELKGKSFKEKAAQEIKQAIATIKRGIYVF
jgi:hypothetical protein